MQRVRSIMTKTVRTISRDKLVSEVAGILDRERIGAAPLVDDRGEMVGIVSKTDIVHFEFVGADDEARVWEISNPGVFTVEASSSIEDAARTMLDNQVHHLVVVDAGECVGILSALDYVELAAAGD